MGIAVQISYSLKDDQEFAVSSDLLVKRQTSAIGQISNSV